MVIFKWRSLFSMTAGTLVGLIMWSVISIFVQESEVDLTKTVLDLALTKICQNMDLNFANLAAIKYFNLLDDIFFFEYFWLEFCKWNKQ